MDDDSMSNQYEEPDQPMQTMDQIMQILTEATIPPACSRSINVLADGLDMDDDMDDLESDSDLDVDSSGEIVYAMWVTSQITILQVNQRTEQAWDALMLYTPAKN